MPQFTDGNESSSSTESRAPHRKKRSFSPASDDEVVVQTVDDDTPPPPDRPVIRQGFAFGSTSSGGFSAFGASSSGAFGKSSFFKAASTIQTYKEDAPKDNTPKVALPGMGGAINGQTLESIFRPQLEGAGTKSANATPPPRKDSHAESLQKSKSMAPPGQPSTSRRTNATEVIDLSTDTAADSSAQHVTPSAALEPSPSSASAAPPAQLPSQHPTLALPPRSTHPSLAPQAMVITEPISTFTAPATEQPKGRKPRKPRAPNAKITHTGDMYKEKKGRFRLNAYVHQPEIQPPPVAQPNDSQYDRRTPPPSFAFAPPIVQAPPPPIMTPAVERYHENQVREEIRQQASLERSAPPALPTVPFIMAPSDNRSAPGPSGDLYNTPHPGFYAGGVPANYASVSSGPRQTVYYPPPAEMAKSSATATTSAPAVHAAPSTGRNTAVGDRPPAEAASSGMDTRGRSEADAASSTGHGDAVHHPPPPAEAASGTPKTHVASSPAAPAYASPAIHSAPLPATRAAPSPAPIVAPSPDTHVAPSPSRQSARQASVPPIATHVPSASPRNTPVVGFAPVAPRSVTGRSLSPVPDPAPNPIYAPAPASIATFNPASVPGPADAPVPGAADPTPASTPAPADAQYASSHTATTASPAPSNPSHQSQTAPPPAPPVDHRAYMHRFRALPAPGEWYPPGTETISLVPAAPNPAYYPTAVSNMQAPLAQEAAAGSSKYYREPSEKTPPTEKIRWKSAPKPKPQPEPKPKKGKGKKAMQSTPAQDASASYTYVPIPSPPPGVSDGSSRQSQAVAWSTNDWNTEFGPSLTSATFDYHNDMPEPPHDERDRVQVLAARTISEGPQKQDDTQQQQWSQGDGGMGPPGGYQQQYQQQQQQEAAGPAKTTRIVTLLIQDMRSEEVDNQLAEVRIPLKGDQDGGFWADAKQVCEQLQNSPSRIDGPAKVYTLRGKYRQFFLRVTADNKDESTSMNLAVSADRTMDVVVETGYVPGTVPTRQKNPHELRAARSQESEREYFEPPARPSRESSSQNGRRRQPSNDFYAPPPPPPSDLRSQPSRYQEYQPPPGRKRKRSPSPDYSMPEDGDWYGMRYELQGKTPPRHIQYQRSKTSYDYNTPMWKKRRRPEDNGDDYKEPRPGPVIARVVRREPASDEEEEREYESPGPDDDEDRLHHKIAAAVDHEFLQKEPDWKEFFMARAKAQNVKNILTQYEIAHEMIVKYVGRDAPFRSCQYKVDTTHIMEALAIEDPRFPIDCADTLRLLRLYGPAGRRESHPQVIEMVNDDRPPEYNAKPMKRLLKLLKEVDQQYVASMRG